MKKLMPEQRLPILQIYVENHGSVRETCHALRPIYGRHNRPSVIRLTMDLFRTTCTLIDNALLQRYRTVHTEEVIPAVKHTIEKDTAIGAVSIYIMEDIAKRS